MLKPLEQLHRLEAAIRRFFGPAEHVDQHILALDLWLEDPLMSLYLVRLRCISAARLAVQAKLAEQLRQDIPRSEAELRDSVNFLCSSLDPSAKHLLYLRFWKGLGIVAIATELQQKPHVVQQSLRRLLAELRLKETASPSRKDPLCLTLQTQTSPL